ncbi:MAG: sigma factor, partial [Pararhizobium sp.]
MKAISSAAQRRGDIDMLDDGALVMLARTRDETAIRTIIKRHNQRLFRTARAIVRDDAEAEDVVQEA